MPGVRTSCTAHDKILRCRINAAFRSQAERCIYAAGGGALEEIYCAPHLAPGFTHRLPSPWLETTFRVPMEKVVIIGSGCAGLAAALYTARANLQPLVVTGRQPGGLLTTTTVVENYPGFPEGVDGYELMVRMQKQAERFGARVKFGAVESADLSKPPFALKVDGEVVEAETIIIASGASHRHLGLESEHKLENKGVTYCATCDGALPIFRN